MAKAQSTEGEKREEGAKPAPFSKKSGPGLQDGVISELATFWEVKPGQAEALRAAVDRFNEAVRSAPLQETMKTGLRSSRFVIFDGGKRLLWATTFETDWEPYIEDALIVVGIDRFLNWLQYTTAMEKVEEWVRSAGGLEKFRGAQGSYRTDPNLEKAARTGSGGLKDIIKSKQLQAASFFEALADLTHPEVRKEQQVYKAFQRVLDNPDAAGALKHPALKPLLDLAAG
jgi:hypothetical protein